MRHAEFSFQRSWLIPLVAALVVGSTALPAFAQLDDFNDGDDDAWTRYDAYDVIGPPSAHFDFPGGNKYQISTDPVSGAVGAGRAASFREQVTLTGSYAAVEVGPWDDATDQAFGLLTRVNSIGLGTTDGYAFTYSTNGAGTGSIDISRIDNEAPAGLGAGSSASIDLDPSHTYKLVLTSYNALFKGRLFDMAAPTTVIATVTATDATYAGGVTGLVTAAQAGGTTTSDATFDNFVATYPGDANADGRVSMFDVGTMMTNWMATGVDWEQGDFNLDGEVTVSDVGILATNYGKKVPVPEPGAVGVIALATATLALRRPRTRCDC